MAYSFPVYNSPNFYKTGQEKTVVVLHATTSFWRSAYGWLMSAVSQASAHGLVDHDQACYLLDPKSWAWHAGRVKNPTKRGANAMAGRTESPNRYTWGIEHCLYYDKNGDGEITDDEKQAYGDMILNSVKMIRDFEGILGRRFTEDEIITHRDLTAGKPNLEVTRDRILYELGLSTVKPSDRDLELQIMVLKQQRDRYLTILIKMLQSRIFELRSLLAKKSS